MSRVVVFEFPGENGCKLFCSWPPKAACVAILPTTTTKSIFSKNSASVWRAQVGRNFQVLLSNDACQHQSSILGSELT